jgi:RNA polymerase sigma factor (sigma-70 family)
MERRHNLVTQFSTFIHWENNRFHGWHSHSRLHRSMVNQLEQDPSLQNTQYWTMFWHQQWLLHNKQDTPSRTDMSQQHLYAYLQEPCYFSSIKIWNNYKHRIPYTVADLFNFGFAYVNQILMKFDPVQAPNIGAFSCNKFRNRILDELRQQDKTIGYTIWNLLLRASVHKMEEALLAHRSVTEDSLELHLNAWEVYKKIYTPVRTVQNRKIQEPSAEIWEHIAIAYCKNYSQIETQESIKKKLIFCADALLKYSSLNCISLNEPKYKNGNSELIESSEILDYDHLIHHIEIENQDDIQEHFQLIYKYFSKKLNGLDITKYRLNVSTQKILELYYGQELKQVQIAEQLGINQSTVARTISKVKEILASQLIDWSKTHLEALTKLTDVETVGDGLEQWFQEYYQQNAGNTQGRKS